MNFMKINMLPTRIDIFNILTVIWDSYPNSGLRASLRL